MLFNKNSAILLAAYLILGFVWIYTSDLWVLESSSDPSVITDLQTSKGWFYVAGSGFLIYFLSVYLNRKMDNASREYMRVFYDHPTPMILRDKNTLIITECNQAAKKLFNRELMATSAKLDDLTQSIDDSFSEMYPDFTLQSSSTTLATVTEVNGTKKYIEIHPQDFVRQSSHNELVVLFDVTSVVKLLMEKQKLIKHLSEYAEATSHNIRKPLSNILGLSELMNSTTLETEELMKSIAYLKTSAEELDAELRKVADGKIGEA